MDWAILAVAVFNIDHVCLSILNLHVGGAHLEYRRGIHAYEGASVRCKYTTFQDFGTRSIQGVERSAVHTQCTEDNRFTEAVSSSASNAGLDDRYVRHTGLEPRMALCTFGVHLCLTCPLSCLEVYSATS